MRFFRYIKSPLGPLTLVEEAGSLTELRFGKTPPSEGQEEETPLLLEGERQLLEYFSGKRKIFSLPLSPRGTEFQRRVWAALLTIPYGQTRSYEDIARLVGCSKGFRAVGLANNRNPLPIFIPCHRVIGKDGSLTGYAGGLESKRFLLELEGVSLK